jgi:hypothetical protein
MLQIAGKIRGGKQNSERRPGEGKGPIPAVKEISSALSIEIERWGYLTAKRDQRKVMAEMIRLASDLVGHLATASRYTEEP